MNLIQKTSQTDLDCWCRRNAIRVRQGLHPLTLEQYRAVRGIGSTREQDDSKKKRGL
jgi:hypothetical protein